MALVITIIVLVILVGVTLSVTLNSGLINNAKNAVADYNKAQTEEQAFIDSVADKTDPNALEEIQAGVYAQNGNKKYKSDGQTAYIPEGFTVSNIEGEKSIASGLVIYSGEVTDWSTAQTTYNQYVWIPVEDPSEMYGTITQADVDLNPDQGLAVGDKYGKLYFKNKADPDSHLNWPSEAGYSNTDSREPAYLPNSTDADDSEYNKDVSGNKIITQQEIKDEFSKMIQSVETYHGFYIGRYELTGTTTQPTLVKGATPLTTKASYSVNSYLKWYGLYTMCQKLEERNEKVHTSMTWGSQWDQAVKKSLADKADFLSNAEAYGWYSDSNYSLNGGNGTNGKQVSGLKKSAYNIFDMGGNVADWTLEAISTNLRVGRGGCYQNSASTYLSSGRSIGSPSRNYSVYGCRPQLYL